MNEIIIIAAIAKNNVIGKDNKIPWYIKDDLIHFKKLTTNHPIIMGRKTFLSLPKKPLPNRTNIVLTSDNNFSYPDIVVEHSLEQAINKFKENDVYVIGGASIYKQSMKFATKLEITRLEQEYEGDTYFPEIDLNIWKLIDEEKKEGYSFLTYIRK